MFEIVFGFICGWLFAIYYLSIVVRDTIAKLQQNQQIALQFTNADARTLHVEQHHGVLYVFEDGDVFITQASTLESVAQNIKNFNKIDRAILLWKNEFIYVVDGIIQDRKSRTENE